MNRGNPFTDTWELILINRGGATPALLNSPESEEHEACRSLPAPAFPCGKHYRSSIWRAGEYSARPMGESVRGRSAGGQRGDRRVWRALESRKAVRLVELPLQLSHLGRAAREFRRLNGTRGHVRAPATGTQSDACHEGGRVGAPVSGWRGTESTARELRA